MDIDWNLLTFACDHTIVVSADGDTVTISDATGPLIVAGHDELTAAIDKCVAELQTLRGRVTATIQAERDTRRVAARDQVVTRWNSEGPHDHGLVELDGRWTHPFDPDVWVDVTVTVPTNDWATPTRTFTIHNDHRPVARLIERHEGDTTLDRRGYDSRPDIDLWGVPARVSQATLASAAATKVWEPHLDRTDVAGLCDAATDPAVVAMIDEIDRVAAEKAADNAAAAQRRERLHDEWVALSRTREKIPTRKLESWIRTWSYPDYAANGAIIGGTLIYIDILAGGERPYELTRDAFGYKLGGRNLVGAAKIYQAVRLTHRSGRTNKYTATSSFYKNAIDELRDTLGDNIVVTSAGDDTALFVCYRRDDLVEMCEAAAVEWTLTRPTE